MLIVNKEKYSSKIPFETLLRTHCTKSSMRPLVDLFVLPVKKSAGKDEFLRDVAMSIQIYPQWWMALLPQYELQLLRQILELPEGEGLTVCLSNPTRGLLIGELCVVVAFRYQDDPDRFKLFLATESLRPYLTDGLKETFEMNAKHPGLALWEQLGLGMLNYFGALPLVDFTREMKRRTGIKPQNAAELSLIKMINTSVSFTANSFILEDDGKSERYIVSPLAEDIDYILNEQAKRIELCPDLSRPSDEELKALCACPLVAPSGNSGKKLYDFLRTDLKLDEEKASWLYHKLWCMLQTSGKPGEILSWINGKAEFDSFEKLQRFMSVFNEFCNETPKWILCGWSSHDVFEKFEKPKLRPLPSAPFRPASLAASIANVGRNDPCPCGSGRKYKNCHGKFSS